MRRSPELHALAVLRLEIGLTQKELADLVEVSPKTIQAVELKKLSLSGKLAEKILTATSASFDWLMLGEPTEPIDSDGRKLNRERFKKYRASVEACLKRPDARNILFGLSAVWQVHALIGLHLLNLNDPKRSIYMRFKVNEAIIDLYREFAPNVKITKAMSWDQLMEILDQIRARWPLAMEEAVLTPFIAELPKNSEARKGLEIAFSNHSKRRKLSQSKTTPARSRASRSRGNS